MKTILLAFFVSIILLSCQKDETPYQSGNADILGNWINPEYNDTLLTYTRSENLVENQYGISFKPQNKLIERQNSGWCGTPPIVTSDYEGTWTRNDSIINITVAYWGGIADYSWKIISIDRHKMVVYLMKSDFHQ
jgi:hypothetical protein